MKWLASVLTICVPLLCAAQEAKQPSEPKTKIEEFLSRKGTIVEKTFSPIGKVNCAVAGELEIEVAQIWESRSNTKISGIVFELTKESSYTNSHVSAYLDSETLGELISALEIVITKSQEMAQETTEYKEILFRTQSDVRLGFFQSGEKQSAFIYLNDWQSDARAFLRMPQLSQILNLLKAAKTKIESM